MAPFGTVIKNGLLFVILLLPIAYISGLLIGAAVVDLNYASTADDGTPIGREDIPDAPGDRGGFYTVAQQEIAIAIVLLFGVGGLLFMKALSDSVEDGMVEF